MKTVIISINAMYIHASLAPWYLATGIREGIDVKVMEFTINDNPDAIFGAIYDEKPDVAAFSCYIWNIGMVRSIAAWLGKVLPETVIVLGGPEVSYDAEHVLSSSPSVSFILRGEGDFTFGRLLACIMGESNDYDIEGLACRDSGNIKLTGDPVSVGNLDDIPSPYTDSMLVQARGRIVYFESSRGCPYSCAYCLSSLEKGVRYFSMQRVKSDLEKLMNSQVRQVKFVDRTFNSDPSRAKEILGFIINRSPGINFHFEAGGDLFDEEMLEMLSAAPPGLIQFETGIQTTNASVLEAICRKADTVKIFTNISRLRGQGRIHLHLDLIAGLPGEDAPSFRKSFNDVYALNPHHFQLGFLKLLKGTVIRSQAAFYGYAYKDEPPYEVLGNDMLPYSDILMLKRIEELLELYYNSGRFASALKYIHEKMLVAPFDFYRRFAGYWRDKGLFSLKHSSRSLYGILLEFLSKDGTSDLAVIRELLRFDFLSSDSSGSLPDVLIHDRPAEGFNAKSFKERCFAFLQSMCETGLPVSGYKGMPAKQAAKKVRFEAFSLDVVRFAEIGEISQYPCVIMFDYGVRDPVSGLYECMKINMI